MSVRVEDHYRRLLAPNYTWMLGGDIEHTARTQRALLGTLLGGPASLGSGTVADLGCGSGAQTLALADMGYGHVLAIDTDGSLLEELRAHARGRPAVETVHDHAVSALDKLATGALDAAVCMGDTLLHLPDRAGVEAVFEAAARALCSGGRLVLTYRDLSRPLYGTDRAIPVRSTDDQIMTCFLDFADEDTVEVHDIVHTRSADGWTFATSSYPKLRLAADWVVERLVEHGFTVAHHDQSDSGLWRTVAHRSA
ncbi:class I SAM-dependent methyltransferase [Spiractinospora alimapuensis]|uniref:class I SAM-dependent methyltransferase n=1 Tax=Spiractinospora alimapuensis TaxID=2820884 RepID=UPI001F3447D3|nr:class I SAM-dependent methyltransferase [Spiractinospora alimapuensis]QVQ50215.1 class I SAM-dependent methyltransferase [Spiractinospora alimapuensis]